VLRAIPARNAALLAVAVAMQLLDLVTFIGAVARVGIRGESNPIARALYQSQGQAGPAELKLVATTVIVLALLWTSRRFPHRFLAAALVPMGIAFAGFASNVLMFVGH